MQDYRDKYRNIDIPISECDIEEFHKLLYNQKDIITWTFETNDGESININFHKEKNDCDECGYSDCLCGICSDCGNPLSDAEYSQFCNYCDENQ